MAVSAYSSSNRGPALPLELLRAVLNRLNDVNEDRWSDGTAWKAFLELRKCSKLVKLETEAVLPWAVQHMAARGTLKLLRLWSAQEAGAKDVEHSAVVQPLKRLSLNPFADRKFGKNVTAAALKQVARLAPNLEEISIDFNVAADPVLANGAFDRATFPALVTLHVFAWTELGEDVKSAVVRNIAPMVPFLERFTLQGFLAPPQVDFVRELPLSQALGLKVLDLPSCRLGVGGATILAEALAQCLCLEELGMAKNNLELTAAAALAPGLAACHSLRKLRLSDNKLQSASLAALNLTETSVTDLWLERNEITSLACLRLGSHHRLQTLSLVDNAIPLHELGLATNTSLEEVMIGGFPIPSYSSIGLSTNKTLKALKIYRTPAQGGIPAGLGAELLGSYVTKLALNLCDITDAGLAELKLDQNSKLTEVRLFGNKITNGGVRALRLRHNRTLRSLDLSGCGVHANAAKGVFSHPWQTISTH